MPRVKHLKHMKNLKLISLAIIAVTTIIVSMSSCSPDSDVEFDDTLLYGEWRGEDIYLKFNSDETGYYYPNYDYEHKNITFFKWSLTKDILILEYEDGSINEFTIVNLTKEQLSGKTIDGITLNFTKLKTFNRTFLYGKWQEANTQNFEVYKEDGTGYTWDEADDVTEAEAQQFTWTLEGDALTHIHIMEMGADIPKIYTVTKLTATELAYEDDFGKIHTFNKQ